MCIKRKAVRKNRQFSYKELKEFIKTMAQIPNLTYEERDEIYRQHMEKKYKFVELA